MYATYQFGANWKNWKCNPCCFLKHIEWYRRNISIDTAPLRRINLQFTDGEIQAEVTNDSDRCCGQEKKFPTESWPNTDCEFVHRRPAPAAEFPDWRRRHLSFSYFPADKHEK